MFECFKKERKKKRKKRRKKKSQARKKERTMKNLCTLTRLRSFVNTFVVLMYFCTARMCSMQNVSNTECFYHSLLYACSYIAPFIPLSACAMNIICIYTCIHIYIHTHTHTHEGKKKKKETKEKNRSMPVDGKAICHRSSRLDVCTRW